MLPGRGIETPALDEEGELYARQGVDDVSIFAVPRDPTVSMGVGDLFAKSALGFRVKG